MVLHVCCLGPGVLLVFSTVIKEGGAEKVVDIS